MSCVLKGETAGDGHSVSISRQLGSLCEVEVHLVIDVLPLWVEPLQDLGEHVDCLLAAEARSLSLELLQQVFSGHGLPDKIPAHGIFCQQHITKGEMEKKCIHA